MRNRYTEFDIESDDIEFDDIETNDIKLMT